MCIKYTRISRKVTAKFAHFVKTSMPTIHSAFVNSSTRTRNKNKDGISYLSEISGIVLYHWLSSMRTTWLHLVCELRARSVHFHKTCVCVSIIGKKWSNERTSYFVLTLLNRLLKHVKWLNLHMVTMLWVVHEYLSGFWNFKFEIVDRRLW